jgi:branched-chain amino acid transport system substrate-binding protein
MDKRTSLKGAAALALLASPALAQDTIRSASSCRIRASSDLRRRWTTASAHVKQKAIPLPAKDRFIRGTGGVARTWPPGWRKVITRDNVDILAGFTLSPNAIAVSKVSAEAKKFMVIMNAATTVIITMSPYSVRTSMTLPSVGSTAGAWAYKSGIRKAYTMVTDFAPGKDAEVSFHEAFKAAGGEIVGSVRMPLANPDFSAFVQRAKDLNPESIFIFVPAGAQPSALGKAFAERGVDASKIKIIGTGDAFDESFAKSVGDAAVGLISVWHYDYNDDSKLNKEFVTAYNAEFKRNPDFGAVDAYVGMHVIYEALKNTGGKTDGDSLVAAARVLSFDSARGAHPDRSRHSRHRAEHLYPAGEEGRRRPAQRRVRQGEKVKDPGRRKEVGDRFIASGWGQSVALGPIFGVLFDGLAYGCSSSCCRSDCR